MAKDPAFLFYPGDYLRDTQCLSEKTQVAYDSIICEHMRNICISKQQLKFFTKRLNEEEIAELKMVLTQNSNGYQIDWVVESIEKRRAYSKSRRQNREGNKDKICKTYDSHMENEIEIENEEEIVTKKKRKLKIFIPPQLEEVKTYFKDNEYSEQLAEKFFNSYSVNDWKDSNDKPVKNWKQKAINVWFKEENKTDLSKSIRR